MQFVIFRYGKQWIMRLYLLDFYKTGTSMFNPQHDVPIWNLLKETNQLNAVLVVEKKNKLFQCFVRFNSFTQLK